MAWSGGEDEQPAQAVQSEHPEPPRTQTGQTEAAEAVQPATYPDPSGDRSTAGPDEGNTAGPSRKAEEKQSEDPEYPDIVVEETDIIDRWGDRLSAFLYFPAVDGEKVEGRFPVILHHTYGADNRTGEMDRLTGEELEGQAEFLAPMVRRGYVVARVAWSGTAGSEGYDWVFNTRMQLSTYDVIEWLGGVTPDGSPSPAAAWSTGRVGMSGISGNGVVQLVTAQHAPPHLVTIVPTTAPDLYFDLWYPGGIMSSTGYAVIVANSQPKSPCESVPNDASEAEAIAECLRKPTSIWRTIPRAYMLEYPQHPTFDSYWQEVTPDLGAIQVPVLAEGNWDDLTVSGTVQQFEDTSSRHNMLWVGNSGHTFGAIPIEERLRWFDYWLKDKRNNGIREQLRDERFRYYVRGEDEWRTAKTYPVPGTQYTEMYLAPPTGEEGPLFDGSLRTAPPASDQGQEQYVYAPGQGRLGGGHAPLNPGDGRVPYYLPTAHDAGDQRLEADALLYVSEPLTEDVEVTGRALVNLWAATSAGDTDFVVKLIDVFPEDGDGPSETEPPPGYARIVAPGWLKGPHRNSHSRPEPIPTGEAVEYEFQTIPTSYLFKKGHRIAVMVGSGDQRLVPNESPASVDVFRNSVYPSRITLPIVPRD